ncbi:MAG: TIGR03943 family protein [Nakamurella sp.]
MNKETRAIVIGMLGGLLLAITLSGKFTSYVKPGFRPMLLIAGGVLVVLAIVSLVMALRDDARPAGEHEHLPESSEDLAHVGHQHSSRAPWLMLAPVLVLLFVAPPALGADSVDRGINCGTPAPAGTTYASRRVQAADPLPVGDPVPLTMQDFVQRSLYDTAYSTVTTDIEVEAFVSRSNCDGAGYSLVRLKISCCAADAIAIRAHVDAPPQYPSDTWVRAVIRAVKNSGDQGDNYVPTATVISLTPISQPADPYLT